MGVDGAAVTSAEAAQYRAAGWWSDATLSDCVRRNAASSPDKPAYIDFSLDCARPSAHLVRVRPRRHQPGPRTVRPRRRARRSRCVVAQRQRGDPRRAGRDRTLRRGRRWTGSPRGRARGRADPADHAAVVVGQRRRAATSSRRAAADPSLRVVATVAPNSPWTRARRPDAHHQPVPRRGRRRLPDQLHFGHHRYAQMRCPHPESVALLPPEGRRQRRAHRRRRVSSRHPHARTGSASGRRTPRRSTWAPRPCASSASTPPRRARRSSVTVRRCCVASVRNWR